MYYICAYIYIYMPPWEPSPDPSTSSEVSVRWGVVCNWYIYIYIYDMICIYIYIYWYICIHSPSRAKRTPKMQVRQSTTKQNDQGWPTVCSNRYSVNGGFANRGVRNRGDVPCAHAKTFVQGSLSTGFRVPGKHFSGHAKYEHNKKRNMMCLCCLASMTCFQNPCKGNPGASHARQTTQTHHII